MILSTMVLLNQIAKQLTTSQVLKKVTNWLEVSHLILNVKKTVSVCISICRKPVNDMFEVNIKLIH